MAIRLFPHPNRPSVSPDRSSPSRPTTDKGVPVSGVRSPTMRRNRPQDEAKPPCREKPLRPCTTDMERQGVSAGPATPELPEKRFRFDSWAIFCFGPETGKVR